MNSKILFVVYPTISHYVSIFQVAKKQQENGVSVYIGGPSTFKSIIEGNGFRFCKISYYESYNLADLSSNLIIFFRSFQKRFKQSRYREFLVHMVRLNECIANLSIEEIYFDAHLAYYYIFIPENIKVYIINTKLSTLKSKYIPPLSSGIILSPGFFSNYFSKLIWFILYCKNWLHKLKRVLIYHGLDESAFITRVLRRQGLEYLDVFIAEIRTTFYHEINLDKIPIITYITGLNDLEYSWKVLHKNERYLKLPPRLIGENLDKWQELKQFLEFKENFSTSTQISLIYVSFGTITLKHRTEIKRFIRKLFNIFSEGDQFRAVISTGGVDCSDLCPSPNIFLGNSIPQTVVLPFSEAAITHGGMNTVRECYHFGVPMLVYPLSNFDQRGNAARVKYHRLGLRGNIKRDSSKQILSKIKFVLALGRIRQ